MTDELDSILYDFKQLDEDLRGATVIYTGQSITILIRDRDRTTHELKKAVSHAVVDVPIQFSFHFKQGFKQEWWLNGSPFNPFGGPALQTVNENNYVEHYYDKHGWLHRLNGPALIDQKYGRSYSEEWKVDNVLHRIGGPAVIQIDYVYHQAGKSAFEDRLMVWYRNGKRYNEGSWAHQKDENCSEVFDKNFIRTLQANRRILRWYDDDQQHHRTDGPAIMTFNGLTEIEKPNRAIAWNWDDWNSVWMLHGEEIPYGNILKWAKRNRILMWEGPCYNRSAFRTDDGEFLFLTEFG